MGERIEAGWTNVYRLELKKMRHGFEWNEKSFAGGKAEINVAIVVTMEAKSFMMLAYRSLHVSTTWQHDGSFCISFHIINLNCFTERLWINNLVSWKRDPWNANRERFSYLDTYLIGLLVLPFVEMTEKFQETSIVLVGCLWEAQDLHSKEILIIFLPLAPSGGFWENYRKFHTNDDRNEFWNKVTKSSFARVDGIN